MAENGYFGQIAPPPKKKGPQGPPGGSHKAQKISKEGPTESILTFKAGQQY